MNFDAQVPLTVIIAVEDQGRRLQSCLHALSRWVAEIIIVCPQSDAKLPADQFGRSVLYLDAKDTLELWEAGLRKSKNPWILLLRSNEVVTGQLRQSIVAKMDSSYKESGCIALPHITVFLKKRFKYPLQWQGNEPSRLVHVSGNPLGVSLNNLRLETPALVGELIAYGDESLSECSASALKRAEINADMLYRQKPNLSAASLFARCVISSGYGFFTGYFAKNGFKENWEGLVFNLADQAANILSYLRYHEKYIRSGKQFLDRPGFPRRILIIKLRDIGDNILATPLCKNLKEKFPQASISILSWTYSLPVFENNPHTDQLFGLPKNAKEEEVNALVKQLSALDFDVIMNLHAGGFSSKLTGKIKTQCLINNNYVGRDKYGDILSPTSDYYRSSIQRDLDCLRSLGHEPTSHKPEIFLLDDEIRWARKELGSRGFDLSREIIIVHPTASVEVREWGMERFGQLIAKIKTRHEQVAVICTNAEYLRVEPMARSIPGLQVFHSITVRQMMALIHESDLVIDNDSALSHIATAFNIPALVLFSQAVREIFRPYDADNDRHWVLYRDVHCRECKLDYCEHKNCLDFTVDEVFEKAVNIINRSH